MSTKTAAIVGAFTGLGWLVVVAGGLADGPAPAPGAPPAPSLLLLADGQVVRGTVLETDDGYVVRTPIGQKLYPRRIVERAFDSIEAIHDYKLKRLPARDPDERLKLAQWCIAHQLMPEAKEHLEAILAGEPNQPRAKAMLFQVNAAITGRAGRMDPSIQRTAGEKIEPPGSLSLNALRDAARSTRPVGPPVVFDLPTPLAIKRYNEFQAYVHRDLQRTCAKCHNEQSASQFQLIEAKSHRDMNNDLLVRANLDAVLRLVDAQDPSRSRLLSAAVMPHKPNDRPILSGPNHPIYRNLATWLAGLKSPTAARPAERPGEGVQPAAYQAPGAPAAPRPNPGFAVGRRGTAMVAPPPPPMPPTTPGPKFDVSPPPSPANIAAPHSIRLPSGETVAAQPAPAGQILPGSTVGMPKTPPAAAPPTPRVTTARTADAAGKPVKTVNVPGIGEVEVVDLDAPTDDPEPGSGKPARKDGINKAALQRFISGGR